MSITSILVNHSFHKGDQKRDAGLTTPDTIERKDNILYGPDEKWNLLDVYYPRNREGKLPVIVSVHGGGWVYGNKEVYQWYCMSLAQRGFAVVNYTYRLAPKYKFPSQLEDTNRVFEWVLKYADEYGFDKNSVFAVGDSAGGHMLALYSSICTNPEYAKSFLFQIPMGFVPKAIGLNCGIYDIDKVTSDNATSDNAMGMLKHLIKNLLGKNNVANTKKANAISFITGNFPPSFIMTSTGDFLASQAPVLVEKLEKLGVKYKYKVYGTDTELLPHVFHCDIKTNAAKICNDEELDFFRNFL